MSLVTFQFCLFSQVGPPGLSPLTLGGLNRVVVDELRVPAAVAAGGIALAWQQQALAAGVKTLQIEQQGGTSC